MKNDYEAYAEYDFGDKRIGERVAKVLEAKTEAPQMSIHGCSTSAGAAKAAYRLLGNANFTTDAFLDACRQQTEERIKESHEDVILVPQDTTELNYHGLKDTEGLGFIGDSPTLLGVMMHSALAVTPEGLPLGLLYCKLWTRSADSFGKSKEHKTKPIEEKESYKWIETMRGAEKFCPENVTYIHICDG